MSQLPAPSLGQFLMSRSISQAYFLASSIQPVQDYDKEVISKVLEQNWDTEEQMVSNLLLCPYLISESSRLEYLLKGLRNPAHPYYSMAAAVGLQSLPQLVANSNELFEALKRATYSEHGMVSMRAFVTLQTHLSTSKDKEFILDILENHKSPLFRHCLLWVLVNVEDRAEVERLLQDEKLTKRGKAKASIITQDYFSKIDEGKESSNLFETLDYIPNFEDFDAMLDKEETLSEFFADIDTDNDGKVTFDEIVSFLEDIGKKIDITELKREVENLDSDSEALIEKDNFIELMFPKFQVV